MTNGMRSVELREAGPPFAVGPAEPVRACVGSRQQVVAPAPGPVGDLVRLVPAVLDGLGPVTVTDRRLFGGGARPPEGGPATAWSLPLEGVEAVARDEEGRWPITLLAVGPAAIRLAPDGGSTDPDDLFDLLVRLAAARHLDSARDPLTRRRLADLARRAEPHTGDLIELRPHS
ncbi:MAG: hypothetical protein AAGK32_01935 [Actinomycetota bacterium]